MAISRPARRPRRVTGPGRLARSWHTHRLPRAAWLVISAAGVAWLGTGLASPYLLVYLVHVQRLSGTTAGLLFFLGGAIAICVMPVIGVLIDRTGARTVLRLGLAVAGAATGCFAVAHGTAVIFVIVCAYLLGQRATTPAGSTLLSGYVTADSRSHAFSMRYAAINVGSGTGGLVGGLIVKISHPGSFHAVFLLQAVLCLSAAVLLSRLREPSQPTQPGPAAPRRRLPVVLRDRPFAVVWLLALFVYVIGISQLNTGFALYITGRLHCAPALLGMAYAISTVTVAAAQLPVVRLVEGRRRMAAVTGMFTLIAAFWLIVLLADTAPRPAMPVIICGAAVCFGMAEALFPPTLPPAAAELAPPGVQGRYNAAFAQTLSVGSAVAPALAGTLLGTGPVTLPLAFVTTAAIAALTATRASRLLPETIIRIPPRPRRR